VTAVGRTRVLGRIVARLRFDDPITVVDHLKLSNPELDALGSARRNAVVLTTTTRDGRSFEARRDTRRGSDERALSRQEILDKFRRLVGRVVTLSGYAR
jgi:2-methylcitrate dehydratase PrpD